MQSENGEQIAEAGIRDEGDIADERKQPQHRHAVHAERGEDQSRGHVADKLGALHSRPSAFGNFV